MRSVRLLMLMAVAVFAARVSAPAQGGGGGVVGVGPHLNRSHVSTPRADVPARPIINPPPHVQH